MQWIIVKEKENGKEVWRYEGQELARSGAAFLIDARFNRDDFLFNGMSLCRGDRFIEAYYQNRWFNVMEIYQGETGPLKGWYCNVTYPARIYSNEIHYRDLALDILIFADRHHLILDENEFEELDLPEEIKKKARKSIDEILLLFEQQSYQSIFDWYDKA
jgi:protein associated with RNAse G/E